MTLLPIVERELRVAARRPKTYRTRCLAAAGLLLLGGGIAGGVTWFSPPGFLVWQAMVALATTVFAVSLCAGAGQPADSLSGEKREGTLGLLFLTDLKSHDIVFGKLVASSIHTLYGLLATFPIFSLVLLVGSVQPSILGFLFLALLNTLFFSLGVGLFASAVSRSQQYATNLAAGIVLGSWAVPGGLSVWLREELRLVELAGVIGLFSPQSMIAGAFLPKVTGAFWISCGITHLAGWLFLGLACLILPRAWQDKARHTPLKPWRLKLHASNFGSAGQGHAFRTRHLDTNPIGWLTLRHRLRVKAIWSTYALVILMVSVFCAVYWSEAEWQPAFVWTSILLHAVTKFDLCALAARQFREERHSGSIELLLTTPLRIGEIIRGQWRALFQIYRWPLLAVICLDISVMAALLLLDRHNLPEVVQAPGGWLMAVGLFVLFGLGQLLDLAALGWLGMWVGLNSRVPAQGSSPAIGIILVLPWGIMVCLFAFLGLLQPPWFLDAGPWPFAITWFVLGLVIDGLAIAYAVGRLRRDFRLAAASRFAPPVTRHWRARLFSRRDLT